MALVRFHPHSRILLATEVFEPAKNVAHRFNRPLSMRMGLRWPPLWFFRTGSFEPCMERASSRMHLMPMLTNSFDCRKTG